MRVILITLFGALSLASTANAEPVHVFGPGGPAPAMKEAAAVYSRQQGVEVDVVAGPTPQWIDQARSNADIIFSGSETMMTDLQNAMGGQIDPGTITPLYLRVSSILVRPGNPRHIGGLSDLFKPGHRIVVVNGAGQNGLWEDMAGRTGDLRKVAGLRGNIVRYAKTSAEAKSAWTEDPSLDAWIIWGIWQRANPTLADAIAVEPEYRIYRDMGAGLTRKGIANKDAQGFVRWLSTPDAGKIFVKWGWVDPAGPKPATGGR
ncbi:hypothetical protein sphantq_04565 (plasmid) [Sphingobium sp. AntQ-1]|uniref:substrate-binding domain-containing protein n=1 Tax=Sphingobium sp. AntQ-1 TaxID=2930091 RepID=UPI00234E9FC2|nr:substrate-binding domain-containing protein [Sphingobium sp. AntQ-1]WCP16069.1 hypothetical protein sphantq_04565 [Sphingobium sp. AntQ-1]